MWEEKIEVLSGLRLILKLTNLYNKYGVHIKYNKNADSAEIPEFIVFSLISVPTFVLTSLLIWAAIEQKFDIKLLSVGLAAIIGYSQTTSVFLSLAIKNDSVISTIDHLQETFERSN